MNLLCFILLIPAYNRILYPHTAGVSLVLKVEGHLRGSRQLPEMARARGPSS